MLLPTWSRNGTAGYQPVGQYESAKGSPTKLEHSASSSDAAASPASRSSSLPRRLLRILHPADESSGRTTTTSYLNGVRGLAALMVYVTHAIERFYGLNAGFVGSPPNDHLAQLPLLRLYHSSGQLCVAVFFVLSGFVLSWGPLEKAHAGETDDVLRGMPARVFRRGFRLFLPALPVALVTGVMGSFGWFYDHTGWSAEPFKRLTTEGRMLQAVTDFLFVANPFTPEQGAPGYFQPIMSPPFWTLSHEFKGSILVYLVTLTLCRVRWPVRLLLLSAATLFCLFEGYWWRFLFLSGMCLADIRLARTYSHSHSLSSSTTTPKSPWWLYVPAWAVFVFALWLGGYPSEEAYHSWGFAALSRWTPEHWRAGNPSDWYFWKGVGGVLLMAALEQMQWGQALFNTRFMLWLGDVSFGLYLVHWMILYSFQRGVMEKLVAMEYSTNAAFALSTVPATLIIFWLADLHWRHIDKRSVALAQRLSKWIAI